MSSNLTKNEVRTRFAPSPTGYMHVGGLRTALYTYLIAKQRGGKFLLRIEDTDQERFVEGATEVIYRTLRDVGLVYDEGPDVGGPVGPYVQSERRHLYKPYAEQLVAAGAAYFCFCASKGRDDDHAELGEVGAKADPCRDLSDAEVAELLAAGKPHVIRQKVPREGSTTFSDRVFGDITVENATLDDQVLLKGDGLPTYNFANVVDDHLMGITHIMRGSEYLSSTPKYNLLYRAFGWDIPEYIHVSPVMKDQTRKLSKRHGDPTYEDLLAQGYLREAVLNYVALLGWSPGGEREVYSLDELVHAFSIDGLSKSPAIFDVAKLTWLNGVYIRALPPEKFAELARPYLSSAVTRPGTDYDVLAGLLQARCELLADIPGKIAFLERRPPVDQALYTNEKNKCTLELAADMTKKAADLLERLPEWSHDGIKAALASLSESESIKTGTVMWPVRIALSGQAVTPGGAVEIAYLLGRDETLRRLRNIAD